MKNKAVWLGGITALGGLLLLQAAIEFRYGWRAEGLLLLALAWALGRGFWAEEDRLAKRCFGALGFAFGLAAVLGMRLDAVQEPNGWQLLACIGSAIGFAPAAGGAALHVCRWLEGLKTGRDAKPRKVFFLSWAIVMLCWLPIFLAFLPGIYGYDTNSQFWQFMNGEWSTHHPLLHTLLIGAFYSLGQLLNSPTLGLGVLTVLQMLALSAAMAYVLSYLSRIGVPRALLICLTALFALMPVHPVLAISYTKDVPFAACMAIMAVLLHQLYRDRELIRNVAFDIKLVLAVAGACLMRNNAVYMLPLFAPFALMAIGKGLRKRLAALLVAAVVLGTGVNSGLKTVLKAEKGLIVEMLCLPAQQLARIYDRYGFDHPVGYEVVEWVPHADMYAPDRADYTKLHLKVKTTEQLVGFLKFWVREFFHYPVEYVDALLCNTRGLWDLNDRTYAETYRLHNRDASETGAFLALTHNLPEIEYTSLLPGLKQLYQDLFQHNEYHKVPFLSLLIHPASGLWLLLLAFAWAVWRRSRAVIMVAAAMILYHMTLFLGPCALTRYSYYLTLVAPLLLGALCAEQRVSQQE